MLKGRLRKTRSVRRPKLFYAPLAMLTPGLTGIRSSQVWVREEATEKKVSTRTTLRPIIECLQRSLVTDMKSKSGITRSNNGER